MVWFKVDDGLASALKTTRIPRARRAAAMGLWVLAGSWAARELTDGLIPDHMLAELACTKRMAADLVEAGFWEVVDGGYQFHNWSLYNPDAASVGSARSAMTDGGQEGNHRRWHVQRNRKAPGCVWCYPEGDDGPGSDGEPRPDRSPESPPDRVPDSGAESGANPPVPVPVPEPMENASHSPTSEQKSVVVDEVAESFTRAWKTWPKKADRKSALARYKTAVKARGGLTELEADVIRFGQAYARSAEEMRFVPGLAPWLNGERWNDDLPVPALRPMTRDDQNMAVVRSMEAREHDQRPTRGQEHLAYIASIGAGSCAPGHHKLTVDGSCAVCITPAHEIATENPF